MSKCYIFVYSENKINDLDINDNDFVICADSSYLNAVVMNVIPSLVIGDFDSIDEEIIPNDIEKIILPIQKDETDTMADGYH